MGRILVSSSLSRQQRFVFMGIPFTGVSLNIDEQPKVKVTASDVVLRSVKKKESPGDWLKNHCRLNEQFTHNIL